jgi:preprotein translocase subunit SecY
MDANLGIGALGRRIGFTLGALLAYRLALHIPLPGIDPSVWQQLFRSQAGGIIGIVNAFSGGAIQRLSILALSLVPYLSAAVLVQLVSLFWTRLGRNRNDGERGRVAMDRITRYLTVLLALFQSYGIAGALEGVGGLVVEPGLIFRLTATLSLTGGTMFLVWLCDVIRARGIGHGLALILCLGLVVEVPAAIAGLLQIGRQGALSEGAILFTCVVAILVTALVVHFERARRRILISFPSRQVGTRVIEGQSHLAFKLNCAGALIPTWLASWFLSLVYLAISVVPGLAERASIVVDQFAHRGPIYLIFYAVLIIGFALLYTAFVLSPDDAARAIEKLGGRLGDVAPGEATAEALDGVFTRTAMIGALYLAFACLVPEILVAYMGLPFYFGGASLLVVVCTTLDLADEVRGSGLLITKVITKG